MTCKSCGAEIADGAKFCENCGNKIEEAVNETYRSTRCTYGCYRSCSNRKYCRFFECR